jgi:tetratricopeptide (TPR) repeat protein
VRARSAALVLLASAAGPAQAADDGLEPARLYRDGRRAEALALLSRRHPEVAEVELDSLRRLDRHDLGARTLTRAALMLHADRAAQQGEEQAAQGRLRCGQRDEGAIARTVGALLTTRPDSREYARRFFVASARRNLEELCLGAVRAWTRAGLKWFPEDAELLLVDGTAAETAGVLGPSMAPAMLNERASDWRRPDPRSELRRARDAFARALRADPSLVEARLRLGRALSRLGEHAAARAELERVASSASDGESKYLCRLFLARVHDDAGRRADAIRAYQEALAAEPGGQTAAIGLAQLLGRAGDGSAGRELLARSVAYAPRQGARDPYWSYHAGLVRPGDAALDALRAEMAP